MRQGKSSTRANRIKKQQRREAKQDLPKYYTQVARVPAEKGLKTYTKLVKTPKADKLINGKLEIGLNGMPRRIKLSRDFKAVA
ncbi:MAG: hypothetical protein J7L15_04375 [Clostridiales bacterium]|nr:hypothetical protein [Clostridiales bacterium]